MRLYLKSDPSLERAFKRHEYWLIDRGNDEQEMQEWYIDSLGRLERALNERAERLKNESL